MARKPRQFGSYSKASRDKIEREGARFGLTRRQSAERVNRGTFAPLSKDPVKRIPENAPFYPTEVGPELKARAMRNVDKVIDFDDPFMIANGASRVKILDAIENHADDRALVRLANASEDELKTWASYQKAYSHKGKVTPEWLRTLGWYRGGKWRNIFWYHAITLLPVVEVIIRWRH